LAQYPRKLKKGNRWWYKFDINGETYFSKAVYSSKIEAKKAENNKYKELSELAQNPSEKPILSLLEAINLRLDYVQVKKSIEYYKDNKRYYKVLLDSIGNVPIENIKRADIEKVLLNTSQKQKTIGKDNYVVNTMIAVYKALFNHVIDQYDLSIKNPCKGVKLYSVNKKLKYIPRDKDIKNIQLTCNHQQNLLIDFVKETGARISEALRFKGSDLFDDYVVLYTSKSKDSNVVPRKIPRPLCLKDIRLKHDEKLFSQWVEKPKFLSRKVSLLKQRPWNWHNLRHRYASLLSKQGKPLFEIMMLLGHSQIKTTQGYLQLIP
jgi:integrase